MISKLPGRLELPNPKFVDTGTLLTSSSPYHPVEKSETSGFGLGFGLSSPLSEHEVINKKNAKSVKRLNVFILLIFKRLKSW